MDFFILFVTAFGSGYFGFSLLRSNFSQNIRGGRSNMVFNLLLLVLALHGIFLWILALFSILGLPLARFWFSADSFVGSLIYPLIFLALKTFLEQAQVSRRALLLHLAPLLVFAIVNLLVSARVFVYPVIAAVMRYLNDYMNIILSPYLIVSAAILMQSLGKSEVYSRAYKKLLGITVFSLIIAVVLAYTYSMTNLRMFDAVTYCVVVILFGIFEIRYVSAEKFFTEIKRQYKRTRISGLDLNQLASQLTHLFEREKVFLKDDLTLETTADHLGLSPHQISEYLNQVLGKKFQQYVNEYRVEYACGLLKTDARMSVLDIAFASGFGTKSSFNSAFRRIKHRNPTDFRKK